MMIDVTDQGRVYNPKTQPGDRLGFEPSYQWPAPITQYVKLN